MHSFLTGAKGLAGQLSTTWSRFRTGDVHLITIFITEAIMHAHSVCNDSVSWTYVSRSSKEVQFVCQHCLVTMVQMLQVSRLMSVHKPPTCWCVATSSKERAPFTHLLLQISEELLSLCTQPSGESAVGTTIPTFEHTVMAGRHGAVAVCTDHWHACAMLGVFSYAAMTRGTSISMPSHRPQSISSISALT